MKIFSRRKLYFLIVTLLLGLVTAVVHAAQLDVDTFDNDAQTSTFGTPCTSVAGTDMMGGERDVLVVRTSGAGTIQADVNTSVLGSLAFSLGAGTRGTALIQLDGGDSSCTLDFALGESLNPYDGLTLFIQQVDLAGIVTMRIYTTATDYSEFSYTLPYAISAPGTEIYFPFDQFTDVGAGANFGSVAAIEILLDGTTIDSLDMTLDYVASDYSRDYGDLPAAYNNTLATDNGARHRIGAVYFGPIIDSEANGQESGDATGDAARTNDETGVVRGGGDWGDGTAAVVVTITKPAAIAACVVGWIDWDGDGVFEATGSTGGLSELVVNTPVNAGNTTINFTSPTTVQYGGAYPATLNARFRVFRAFEPLFSDVGITPDFNGCTTGNPAGTVTQLVFGEATDGEVEDYQWGFGPLAITLGSAETEAPDGWPLVVALLFSTVMVNVFVVRKQRQNKAK